MGYLGRQPSIGRFAHLDDITSSFNSACTTFSLTQSAVPLIPGAASNLIVSLGGVLQEPEVAYTVNGSSIIFSSAPANTQPFFGILLGDVLDVGQVSQGAVINASSFSVGANVVANTSAILVGNATVNSVHTAISLSVANSTNTATLNPTSLTIGSSVVNTTAVTVGSTNKIYLDGGGDTYLSESSANVLDLYAGGANTLRLTATGATVTGSLSISDNVGIAATKRLYLDGGGDTYMLEYDANRLAWYGGGTLLGLWNSTSLDTRTDVSVAATKKLYLDGGSDTYITESSANVLSLYSGGVESKLTSGVLTVSGFGSHNFSAGGAGGNVIALRNTTSGTGNYTSINLGNDASATAGQVLVTSSTYTTSSWSVQDSMALYGERSGGISIAATHASGAIRFYSGGSTERVRIQTGGQTTFSPTDLTFTDGVVSIAANLATTNLMAMKATTNGTGGSLIVFENAAGSVVGKIYQDTTSTTAYVTSSDRRLKYDGGIATSVDVLAQTRVHDGHWLNNGVEDRFIFAQEAVLVKPRAVSVGTDERTPDGALKYPWQLDYSKYVPDLIVGWQQHDAQIASLAARVAALEAQLNGN